MKALVTAMALGLAATAASAEISAEMEALADALQMDQVVDILRKEGLANSEKIAGDFIGRVSSAWIDGYAANYDADWMRQEVMEGIEAGLEGQDLAPIQAFFTSELGQRITGLELSARVALLDPSIETVADEMAETLEKDDPERYAQLTKFIEVNDLIDSNVIGALNSNFAFLQAYGAGDPENALTDSELLNELYGQEPDIRLNTTEWLYSYLNMAYQPLSDEDLQLYIDFSASTHGQAINEALFDGFNDLFVEINRNTGALAGQLANDKEL